MKSLLQTLKPHFQDSYSIETLIGVLYLGEISALATFFYFGAPFIFH